jgi:myosin-1
MSSFYLKRYVQLFDLEKRREGYWHNKAIVIQRCYRAWSGVKLFVMLRKEADALLAGRKERRKASLIAKRKFFGDYLNLQYSTDTPLLSICQTNFGKLLLLCCVSHNNVLLLAEEVIIFSAVVEILTPRALRSSVLMPRTFIVVREC